MNEEWFHGCAFIFIPFVSSDSLEMYFLRYYPLANHIGRKCDFEKLYSQSFSIPSSIIYYITKNPVSPSTYEKLIRSCKHFFAKNPIIVVDGIRFSRDDGFSVSKNLAVKSYKSLNQVLCKFWVDSLAIQKCPINLNHRIFRVNELYLNNDSVILEQILCPEVIEAIRKIKFRNTISKHADGSTMSIENLLEFFPNLESIDL